MPGPASSSRFTRFLVGLPLLSACAAGSDDGLTGFSSAAYTAGPVGDSGDGETEGDSDGSGSASADGSGSASADGTSTSGGGDDGGNPLCCEPGGQAGCGSDATESCVCAALTSCCEAVWTSDCVDLAIACGDPFCADEPTGTADGGDPPPECPDFVFMPEPTAGASITVTFSDPVGLVYVGMYADGPGGASIQGSNEDIRGSMGAFTWSYDYSGLAAGLWTFRFIHRDSVDGPELVRGTCQRML